MKKILVLFFILMLLKVEIFLCTDKKESKRDINIRISQISSSTGLSQEYIINLYKKGYSLSTVLFLGKVYKATGIEPLDILKLKEDDEEFEKIIPYFGIKTLGKYKTIGDYLKAEYEQPTKELKKVKKTEK